MKPGERLKQLRLRLGVSIRDVEDYSRLVSEIRNDPEYVISNTWLSAVEIGDSTPSIYKLYSLSVIYGVAFTELLAYYGVDLDQVSFDQAKIRLPYTRLVNLKVYDDQRRVAFPIRLDAGFNLATTNLLPRMVETWGEIPISLIQHLNIRESLYGYIGLSDFFMYPILRPGSFVQIDKNQTVIAKSWRTDLDRPIYFLELHEGYACSWVEVMGKNLLLIPHPQSGCRARLHARPTDVEVIGRVTAVAMKLVPPPNEPGDGSPKLPAPL